MDVCILNLTHQSKIKPKGFTVIEYIDLVCGFFLGWGQIENTS